VSRQIFAVETAAVLWALQSVADFLESVPTVPRRKLRAVSDTFGQRLARFRQARGLTQAELGESVGLSQRMVAYYESQSRRPPAHVLPEVARALRLSLDELLGLRPAEPEPAPRSARLRRKLRDIERLPAADRKAILKVLDAYLARYVPDAKP
jgi:transcriptional regulator with XRE-family HTH domain